jgi:hypothetical protein
VDVVEAPALYVRAGDAYVGTELIQGGWDPSAANGGAALALLGHVLDDLPTLVPMAVSRFSADLVRPVPLGRPLHVRHEVVREGKKIQLVELRLQVDGVDHVRASALRLREEAFADAEVPPSTTVDRPADGLVPAEDLPRVRPQVKGYAGFLEGVDMRKSPSRRGPAGTWVRLAADVVAGEATNPTGRMACAFDFANLIGLEVELLDVTMINPDVTAQVLRPARGEWMAVTGSTRFEPGLGRGVSQATLSDADGVFAVASTSSLVQRRSD